MTSGNDELQSSEDLLRSSRYFGVDNPFAVPLLNISYSMLEEYSASQRHSIVNVAVDIILEVLSNIFGFEGIMKKRGIRGNNERNVREAGYPQTALIPEFIV